MSRRFLLREIRSHHHPDWRRTSAVRHTRRRLLDLPMDEEDVSRDSLAAAAHFRRLQPSVPLSALWSRREADPFTNLPITHG
jgi:hypothetical protein